MAKAPTLTDVTNLANAVSAVAQLAMNNARLEEAFDNTVSRDGSTPNHMLADFDLNSHKLLNVADPKAEMDGVNLRSVRTLVDEFASEIVETAVYGTQVVDTFTATAGQTTRTLPSATTGTAGVAVFVNGLALTPEDDYSISGVDLRTLTFAAALTAGQEVLIRYTKALPSGVTDAASVSYSAGTVKTYLDSLAGAGGSAMLGFQQAGPGAALRNSQSKLRENISVRDYGAIADGTSHPLSERYATLAAAQAVYPHATALTDEIDWAAFQAAINYAESVTTPSTFSTNALVRATQGSYVINRTLRITKPISVVGDGYGDITTNNPNGTGRGLTSIFAVAGMEDQPMVRVVASTSGDVLIGGRFVDILMNGQGRPSYGFYGSSLSHWNLDVVEYRCRLAGMRLDDANATLNSFNEIRNEYIAGVDGTTQSSHGLWIVGTQGSSAGNPQQRIFKSFAYTVNGDNLRFESDVDNAIVYYASGIVTGTGRNLALISAFSTPRVNTFLYWAGGKAYMDINTYGNVIWSTSSETTYITGTGQYHLQGIVDYGSGGMWQTNRYLLSDELSFAPTDFQPSAAGAGSTIANLSNFLPCWTLDAAADEAVATSRLAPKTWRNAKITKVRINYSFNSAPGPGTIVVLKAHVQGAVSTTGMVVGVPVTKSGPFALPNNTPGSNYVAVLTLDTPLTVPNDGLLTLAIQRMGSDALDTAAGDLYLTGATLVMESLGPQTAGSGSIVVPPMGT